MQVLLRSRWYDNLILLPPCEGEEAISKPHNCLTLSLCCDHGLQNPDAYPNEVLLNTHDFSRIFDKLKNTTGRWKKKVLRQAVDKLGDIIGMVNSFYVCTPPNLSCAARVKIVDVSDIRFVFNQMSCDRGCAARGRMNVFLLFRSAYRSAKAIQFCSRHNARLVIRLKRNRTPRLKLGSVFL